MPWRVNDIDLTIFTSDAISPSGGNRSRGNRNAAFALLDHPVGHSRAFMHFTHAVNAPRIEQDTFRRRGLARINMRNNSDIADTFNRVINTHNK